MSEFFWGLLTAGIYLAAFVVLFLVVSFYVALFIWPTDDIPVIDP